MPDSDDVVETGLVEKTVVPVDTVGELEDSVVPAHSESVQELVGPVEDGTDSLDVGLVLLSVVPVQPPSSVQLEVGE